jgi:hypothetical protein
MENEGFLSKGYIGAKRMQEKFESWGVPTKVLQYEVNSLFA